MKNNSEIISQFFVEDLVQLPYNPSIYLCPDTMTRWRKSPAGFTRDKEGERQWKEMATYPNVSKSYNQVFMEALEYARNFCKNP